LLRSEADSFSTDAVRIVARNLSAPASWLPHEVEFLRQQLASSDSAECRAVFTNKLVALAKYELSIYRALKALS